MFVKVTLTLATDEGDPESVNRWLYVKALPYCAEPAVVYQAEKSVPAGNDARGCEQTERNCLVTWH